MSSSNSSDSSLQRRRSFLAQGTGLALTLTIVDLFTPLHPAKADFDTPLCGNTIGDYVSPDGDCGNMNPAGHAYAGQYNSDGDCGTQVDPLTENVRMDNDCSTSIAVAIPDDADCGQQANVSGTITHADQDCGRYAITAIGPGYTSDNDCSPTNATLNLQYSEDNDCGKVQPGPWPPPPNRTHSDSDGVPQTP